MPSCVASSRTQRCGSCISARSASLRPRSSCPLTGHEVLISKTAVRQLDKLERVVAERIRRKLRVLEEDPFRSRPGADLRLLWGDDEPPLYRLRVGDYRILYFVVGRQVRITEVLHRSQAYRGLD